MCESAFGCEAIFTTLLILINLRQRDVLNTFFSWIIIYAISNDVSNVDNEMLKCREETL